MNATWDELAEWHDKLPKGDQSIANEIINTLSHAGLLPLEKVQYHFEVKKTKYLLGRAIYLLSKTRISKSDTCRIGISSSQNPALWRLIEAYFILVAPNTIENWHKDEIGGTISENGDEFFIDFHRFGMLIAEDGKSSFHS